MGSVVIANVRPNSVTVGNPVRLLRYNHSTFFSKWAFVLGAKVTLGIWEVK
jgi:hypothetical protein